MRIAQSAIVLFLCFGTGHDALANDAPPVQQIVYVVKTWQGIYASRDRPGGVDRTPTESRIYTLEIGGRNGPQLVTQGGEADLPTFSPDGDWIYFQSKASGHFQVYRCRPDGSGTVTVARSEQLGSAWKDAFGFVLSRDGKALAYATHDGTTGRVVVARADGARPSFLAPGAGYTYMAALSSSGDRVVFSGPGSGYRLRLCTLPARTFADLTPDHPNCFVPQFTADDRTIVFIRRGGDIYRVDVEGGNLRQLTHGNQHDEFKLSAEDHHGSTDGPSLSRDGKWIAYVAVRDGVSNVWTMRVDGSEQRQLTRRNSNCARARWSPDGKQVAFVSFEGAFPQLFVIGIRGGGPRRLTDVKGAVTNFDWRPLAVQE